MARTKYGYLHSHFGPDMDGCSRSFTWVKDEPQHSESEAGWFALCEVEPEAGWIGPFASEDEAVAVATTEDGFVSYMYAEGYEYRGEDA